MNVKNTAISKLAIAFYNCKSPEETRKLCGHIKRKMAMHAINTTERKEDVAGAVKNSQVAAQHFINRAMFGGVQV